MIVKTRICPYIIFSIVKDRLILLFFLVLLFFIGRVEANAIGNNVMTAQLKNGLKIVLIVNRSSPMIASVVTVNAGSANETMKINGISHMLEHLLFNGTTNRTQEQLYHEQDYYGIYNNAHTSKDYTNYIVLAEKDFFHKALEIQSDMLFNSIFPERKFGKEKGIILNELAKDGSRESFWVDEFFNRILYQGTPYNLTVLGTESSIKQIKREQVIEYYKTYYRPNNMTVLIMGDFETREMLRLTEKYFGGADPGRIHEHTAYQLDSKNFGKRYFQKIKSNNIHLNLGFAAPRLYESDFYAFDLFSRILSLHLKMELNNRMAKQDRLLEVSSSFNFLKGLSSFTISVALSSNSDPERAEKEIYDFLKEFVNREFNKTEIKGILTSLEVNEQFLFEKPHYYGMMKGAWIAAGGWKFAASYIDELTKVSIEELKRAGQNYFIDTKGITCIAAPGYKTPELEEKGYYISKKNKKTKFTKKSVLLTEMWEKEKSVKDKKQTPEEASGQPGLSISKVKKPDRIVFKNGLTLLINSSSDSQVFAVHMLAKNRTAMEPPGKEGIADFLHRMIERRTAARDHKQLQEDLNSIGAVIKTKDNPYIPYDDYYNSREFSYIRFETIDKFYKEAIYNLSDIVLNPSFLEENIKEVKAEMINLIRKDNENPSKIAKNILYEELFLKNPFFRRINGVEDSISSITSQDMKDFYTYYFAPNNLIISVATSVDKALVLKEFEKYFKAVPKRDIHLPPFKNYPAFSKSKTRRVNLNKSQSYIRMGVLFKMNAAEEPALRVLAGILSEKLSQTLRETKGLAYSLGAGFSMYNRYGVFEIAVGTRSEKLPEAEKGIYEEMEHIKEETTTAERLNRLINFANSRRLMRSLSRISQCYKLGLYEFLGKPLDYDINLLQDIKKIKPGVIKGLAKKYLRRENMVTIFVE